MLAVLGVSYVVAGDYAGWNYGFAASGWGGLAIAVVLAAALYLCIVFALAELASMIPAPGGAFAFAKEAFGGFGGYAAATCVAAEYISATAVIGIFLVSYFQALFGFGGPIVIAGVYLIFLTLHLLGVGEAMKVLVALSAGALIGLITFFVVTMPHFTIARLWSGGDNVPAGFLPFGIAGIWTALPYAMAFFLAVEGVPLASAETKDPIKSVPRAMIWAWSTLVILAIGTLIATGGSTDIGTLAASDSPLLVAMSAVKASPIVISAVNALGLAAIAASFFSLIYAYSRQIFAMAAAGYLPRFLAATNRRSSPYAALLVPAVIALPLTIGGNAAALVAVTMLSASASYLLIFGAFLRLRKLGARPRPYRAPGGIATAWIGIVLCCIIAASCFAVARVWSLVTLVIILLVLTYYPRARAMAARLPR